MAYFTTLPRQGLTHIHQTRLGLRTRPLWLWLVLAVMVAELGLQLPALARALAHQPQPTWTTFHPPTLNKLLISSVCVCVCVCVSTLPIVVQTNSIFSLSIAQFSVLFLFLPTYVQTLSCCHAFLNTRWAKYGHHRAAQVTRICFGFFCSTNLDHSGIVRRRKKKKNNPQRNESDPFEDLLGTPQAIARLRWSQELNPLYDLIRGMKISESISSQEQGIMLYSASAPDSDSKKLKKMPSTIFEESETSPKHENKTETVIPVISLPEQSEEGEEEGDMIPMIIPEHKSAELPRAPRRQHNYEEVALAPRNKEPMTTSIAGLIQPPPVVRKMRENAAAASGGGGSGSATLGGKITGAGGGGGGGGKSSLAALTNPAVRRLQTLEAPQERSGSVSPRLGKRELQRRSRTVSCVDDTEAVARKQKPLREADMMKVGQKREREREGEWGRRGEHRITGLLCSW